MFLNCRLPRLTAPDAEGWLLGAGEFPAGCRIRMTTNEPGLEADWRPANGDRHPASKDLSGTTFLVVIREPQNHKQDACATFQYSH